MIMKLFKTILVLSLCLGISIPSNAAVSVSDGSAFVTNAEFNSDVNNLENRMASLENSIDAKIDSLVSSYLTRNGIWNGVKQELTDAVKDKKEHSFKAAFTAGNRGTKAESIQRIKEVIVAKTNKAHELLAEGFKNKTITREYLALAIGELQSDKATIDAPIGRDKNDRKKMCVTDENSKHAITHLEVLKRYKGYTLIKLKLETGRTHQIRVHMKYIGYPIYNDPVYTNHKCSEFGQFLHSYSLDFIHPITNEHLHFECELPKEFQEFLDTLTSL